MLPLTLIATAAIPGGSDDLRLMRRGGEFSIMLGANELMNSRRKGSEEALATLVAARLTPGHPTRILIGGLGMGFTLRAALDALGEGAFIDVAELVPAVVAWARGPLAELFGGSLADPRVTIHEADVADLIRPARSIYDAVLLDVDNGPEGLTRPGNDALYDDRGLAAIHAALRPGGILAVWSSAPSAPFTRRLRSAGYAVEVAAVRAGARRGARHTIWLAKRG